MAYSPRGGWSEDRERDTWRGSRDGAGGGGDYSSGNGAGGYPGQPAGGYGVQAPYDDAYDGPRRGRTPDEDRRKRRRSPSAGARGPGGTDTYIPSYHRDRSPPYRERRGPPGGGYDYPGYGNQGGGFQDRYDGRPPYPRDSYQDPYMTGSSSYDRRPTQNAPRSQLKSPHDLPYLVPFAYFRDWMRDEDHRTFDDKAKLDEAYKKYRSTFLYKANQAIWTEIKGMSWCKEKYGISTEEVAARKAIREKGREGKMDKFLETLQTGAYDDLSLDQKASATASPPKRETKLETDGAKPEQTDEDATKAVKEEDNDATETPKMEDNGDEEEAKPQVEKAEGSVAGSAMEIGSPAKQAEEQLVRDGADKQDDATNVDPNDDVTGKTSDEDSVLIPPSTHTLFIKALSPDISRADLETHCKQVEGFNYVALGEPNPLKRFHRVGWIVFKEEANMELALEKLSESKINDFTLHLHIADKATYQRARLAPSVFASLERIRSSLEQAKQIVTNMETEADDRRGSEAIEKRMTGLREHLGDDSAQDDGSDDKDAVERKAKSMSAEQLERYNLDLLIQYLRDVFHVCFYCVYAADFQEELTKKCVKHMRRAQPAGKMGKEKEAAFIKNFDERIQLLVNRDAVEPVDFGGESYQEELTKICKPNIQVEDEGKYRCKICKKLFKAAPFVEKHILNKHPDVVGDRLEQLKYYNNFALDPGHASLPAVDVPQFPSHGGPGGMGNGGFMMNSGVASTFGAFNQMFNPNFGGGAYGVMGGAYGGPQFGAGAGGFNSNMFPTPMSASFNGGGGGFGYGGPAGPLSGDARALGNRIGDRAAGFDMGMQSMRMNGGNKRARRESGIPPPPPKGAKIDPRAGKLHAYTDLDGPPAGGGGGDDMMLDY